MSINEKDGFDLAWFIGGLTIFVFSILRVYRYFYPKSEGLVLRILRAENKKLKSEVFNLKCRLISDEDLLRAYKQKLTECENDTTGKG